MTGLSLVAMQGHRSLGRLRLIPRAGGIASFLPLEAEPQTAGVYQYRLVPVRPRLPGQPVALPMPVCQALLRSDIGLTVLAGRGVPARR